MTEHRVVMTRGIADTLADTPGGSRFMLECLSRFYNLDWGSVDGGDWAANDHDYRFGGGRVLAAYKVPSAFLELVPPGCHKPHLWICGYPHPDGGDWLEGVTLLWPSEY